MSVSDKDKLRLRCAEVRCGVLFLFDVVELRRVEDVAVRADGAFEVGRIRKRLKPGEFVHGERFAVTLDGISGEIDEGRAVAAARDGVVMVAGEDGRAALADGAERLGGEGAVPDDVAEADHFLDSVPTGIGENALKGFEVGVDVADDCVFHWMAGRVVPIGLRPSSAKGS